MSRSFGRVILTGLTGSTGSTDLTGLTGLTGLIAAFFFFIAESLPDGGAMLANRAGTSGPT
jgi:hypothetical protein